MSAPDAIFIPLGKRVSWPKMKEKTQLYQCGVLARTSALSGSVRRAWPLDDITM
jgi:hypothetical protein